MSKPIRHDKRDLFSEQRITRYPDEPHPDNEHEWKAWWVKKCFQLDKPLTEGAVKWIHQCWITTKAGWDGLWVPYQPHRQRDKKFYDIKLRDGTIVECCWPNGLHFTPMGGQQIPKKAGLPPYPDYRVIAIRLCKHPMD